MRLIINTFLMQIKHVDIFLYSQKLLLNSGL